MVSALNLSLNQDPLWPHFNLVTSTKTLSSKAVSHTWAPEFRGLCRGEGESVSACGFCSPSASLGAGPHRAVFMSQSLIQIDPTPLRS